MTPTSAFQTTKERSLCTGLHTVRSPAPRKLSAVSWYAHTHAYVRTLKSVSPHIIRTYQSACYFFCCVCRRQHPLSPCWTGRTTKEGLLCISPLQTGMRRWWRCWRRTRAAMWRPMITSSGRHCTGQLCWVSDHRSCTLCVSQHPEWLWHTFLSSQGTENLCPAKKSLKGLNFNYFHSA